MTKKTVIGFFAIMAIGSLAARAATLIVDDNLQCPGATYPTIQGAVTAASPGDTIKVCPGTYVEQVMITKNLKVEGIAFNNENLALVMPAPVGANSTSLSGNPVAAIILVDGASNVSLTNLTVDGAAGGRLSRKTVFNWRMARRAQLRAIPSSTMSTHPPLIPPPASWSMPQARLRSKRTTSARARWEWISKLMAARSART